MFNEANSEINISTVSSSSNTVNNFDHNLKLSH